MKKTALIIAGLLVLVCGGGYMGSRMMAARAAATKKDEGLMAVARETLVNRVVETGTIDAVKTVEVKSRASGRLKKLYVQEGDIVKAGQLIAEIDPQETELKVRQDRAQLRGASSNVTRTSIEMDQRRVTARENLKQAEIRVSQLQSELRIQPTLTNASVRVATAALDSARKEIERLDKTAHPNQRVASETAVREAQANFDNAKSEAERQAELLQQGYVSQKIVENTKLSLELARVRLQQANENASRLETQLRIERQRAEDDLQRSQAELDRAKANGIQDVLKRKEYENALADLSKARVALRDVEVLAQSRIAGQSSVDQLQSVLDDTLRQLSETQIRSPLDGVVTKQLVQEGELVASLSAFSSGTPILRIEDRTALRVMLSINEIDTAKLRVGMKAEIAVDAFPADNFTGSVRRIAPASVAVGLTATGTPVSTEAVVKYEVEIWLDKSDPRLRSGMSAKCSLEVARRDKVLTLPTEYVGKDDKGRFVEFPAKTPTGKPEQRRIKTGLETGAKIEILEGVKEGDKVARPKFTGPARQGFMQAGREE
ncbi:MAG: efflux RND transporter periplasmic adaptor subunit [Methanoregulaceae archaeon]|nr:efflux RND transporter periplasmic adaptor subunit [Methanoregulaceae archaeon]